MIFYICRSNFLIQLKMVTPETISQNSLESMLQRRDPEGFSRLYDRYAGALLGVLRRTVQREDEAEDLLQEVFVKVWRNIESFDADKGSLFTWLLNITRNTAIDYFRSKKYKQSQKSESITDRDYVLEKESPARTEVESIGLRNLVAKMEPKYREVIDLIYFWGYTQDEVSKLLELPLGTVKTRARTGLQLLRAHFGND
jgi:RNA polymerase sigma-70 factor (ECF subfamily)